MAQEVCSESEQIIKIHYEYFNVLFKDLWKLSALMILEKKISKIINFSKNNIQLVLCSIIGNILAIV